MTRSGDGASNCLSAECFRNLSARIAACFLSHFFTFGPLYSFPVFLPAMRQDLGMSLSEMTAVGSCFHSSQFFGSLLGGLLTPRLGHRAVAVLGGVCPGVGFVLCAYASSSHFLYVPVFLAGWGMGAANLAGLTALNAGVSKERRSFAVGLATSGTPLGTLVMAPLNSALISALGWRPAVQLFGASASVMLLAVAPFFLVEGSKVPEAAVGRTSSPAASDSTVSTGISTTQESRRRSTSWIDVRFACFFLNQCIVFLGFFLGPTLLSTFAVDELRLEQQDAAAAYMVMAVFSLIVRLSLGYVTKVCGGARWVHGTTQLGLCILTIALPQCWNFASLLVWSALFGCCIGAYISLISVVLSELFGVERLPLYHGFSRLGVALGAFVGSPVLGRVIELTSYEAGLAIAGGIMLLSMPVLTLLAVLQCRHVRTMQEQTSALSALEKTEKDETQSPAHEEDTQMADAPPKGGKVMEI
eukprot:TRINITY_DN47768_c0_g1_i1.p1 TRINITY_DN47768_c0_g1~~TRINITY_DN47768_c0_g1_i1.p1  ORF type:complete len:472 (-),score=52.06 TRINITY_DN47768_c0_g1_i1:174-1589(-)